MKLLASTFTAFLLCLGIASAQMQPTLSLDFEKDADAVGANGKIIAPRVEGNLEFQDGKFGKALKSGPDSGYLHFPTAGVLRPESGTVEMWVMPIDWDGAEEKFHVFFDVRGEGALYLYKFWKNNNLLMLSAPQISGPFNSAPADIKSWKPGEWHHIAGTWSPHFQAVYVDGKRISSLTSTGLPKSLGAEFMIGDNPWSESIGTRTSSSLIDRVRIYDRALSDEHIAAHFAGDYNKIVPLSDATLKLSYSIDAATKSLSAGATAQGADVENGTRLSFAIRQNGRDILTQPAQEFATSAIEKFSLANLKPGDYEVTATATKGEKQIAHATQELVMPKMEWLGNTLGLNAGVLPPWTPLQVKRDGRKISVSCWGREYQFANAPLPTQILSQNEPLLQAPIALKVLAGGNELQWKNGAVKIISQSPEMVTLQGRANAPTPQGNLELQTDISLAYDGVMTFATHFNAPAGFAPQSVQLEIPVRAQNALYRHRWAKQWTGTSGNVPPEMGVVDKTAFAPFSWLGDNERGLFWFCESGQNWPNFAAENALEVVRANNSVTMRFNLLGAGQTLPQNWNYQFGLQATPVKPIPRDWRKWRMQPAKTGNISIIWPGAPPNNKNAFKYFGSPIATDPKLFAERVEKLHADNVKAVPYSWLSFLSTDVPEWKWFENEWRNGQVDPSGLPIGWGATWDGTNPYSRTFSDYVIWRNHELLRDFKLDGYYHDQAHPYPFLSPELNLGWKDAKGQLQPIYPILAYRDLYRRLYAMTKKENPNAFLMAHMSGKVTIPFLAYEDSYLDGENFRGVVRDSYMDVAGLDYWRAELMGKQWGIMPFFLPEFDAEHAGQIEPTRGLAALVLLHDISVWPIWSNVQVWDEMYDALDKFGYVDSDFIPYFDPTPPATTDIKDVYISVYKRKDGRALAIVGNTSREDRSGTITLNAKRIGLPTSGVLSWPDKTPVVRDGEKIKLDVPRLGYRMLLIGKAPEEK
jgi:hypothetical protein